MPTPRSAHSPLCAQNTLAATVFSSSSGSAAPLPGIPDTLSCGSRATLSLPASPASAGIPTSASPAPLPATSLSTLRRSSGSHTAGWTPPRSAARRSAAGSPETCSTASALPPCVLRAPPVFFNHRFQHLLVQTQIRHQFLQPPVFIFQLPQPLRFSHAHPAVLGLPRVDGVLRYSQLPPHLRRAPARFHLLQRPDHLHFAILPLRHVFTSTHPPALL